MNILLVEPQLNNGNRICQSPSQALLILGTLAKQRGHDVTVCHRQIDDMPKGDFDIVGVTTNTFQCKDAKNIISNCNGAMPIIGGPHAEYIQGIHNRVIGEGENQWLDFLGETPDIENIDDVPWPDYSLVDLNRFSGIVPAGDYPSMAIMASRGCPNDCIFCNTPKFWGKKVRYRDSTSVVDEVERLNKDFGVKEVFFQDDTFNLNHKWASEIFEGIVNRGLNKSMVFKICCRVNEQLLTRDFLRSAYLANVWNIFYGIESGSQKMLDSMKKRITVEEAERAIKLTHEANICTQASFVFGLPGENRKTIRETDNFIQRVRPNMVGASIATPFPDTEFDRIVTEKGHKKDIPYEEYSYGVCAVRTDALDYDEVANIKVGI